MNKSVFEAKDPETEDLWRRPFEDIVENIKKNNLDGSLSGVGTSLGATGNVSKQNFSFSELNIAVGGNDIETVNKILASNNDVNLDIADGILLTKAIKFGYPSMVKLLVDKGASIDSDHVNLAEDQSNLGIKNIISKNSIDVESKSKRRSVLDLVISRESESSLSI